MTIVTLEQDLAATEAINQFRAIHGMSKARNPYPWHTYAFTGLCYYPNGATFSEVLTDLQSVGIGNINPTYSGYLTKVANGEERNPVTRNYSFKLPGFAEALSLVIKGQKYTGSRPANIFCLIDPKLARETLISRRPETVPLFKLLDKKKF